MGPIAMGCDSLLISFETICVGGIGKYILIDFGVAYEVVYCIGPISHTASVEVCFNFNIR